MIDIDKLVTSLDIPDGMTVDEMRTVAVGVLDTVRANNDAEKLLIDENTSLKTENARLSAQNLELFNRVTTSMASPASKTEEDAEDEKTVTTDDILNYYS